MPALIVEFHTDKSYLSTRLKYTLTDRGMAAQLNETHAGIVVSKRKFLNDTGIGLRFSMMLHNAVSLEEIHRKLKEELLENHVKSARVKHLTQRNPNDGLTYAHCTPTMQVQGTPLG